MAANIIWLFALSAIAALLGWLVLRAWRKRGLLRWTVTPPLTLVTVLVTLFVVLAAVGAYQAYAPRGNPVQAFSVDVTPEKIARGEHLAATMCASCHTLNDAGLPLTGGDNLFDVVPMPIGTAFSPNLTPGGRIADWSDGELARAIREGTYPNGHLMPVMASNTFRVFSEDDMESIIVYLRSQAAVVPDKPAKQSLSPLGLAMLAGGMFPVKPPPDPDFPAPVAVGPTVEYGAYIAGYTDCAICHGNDFTGGTSQLAPQGPNLVTVNAWTADQFITVMRTGISPTRGELGEEMPWEYIGLLDDEELTALYEYVKSLPY